jgi:ribosomal protein S18 acetylase RimI-like enzyme
VELDLYSVKRKQGRTTFTKMPLITADAARIEEVLDGTYPIWNEELTRDAYSRWNRAQMDTGWGREHLRRLALLDGDMLLASAKRYDFDAVIDGQPATVLGVGAVFTPVDQRGRGHASMLVDAMCADAIARGCSHALLFSEIGARFYERHGFVVMPADEITLEVAPHRGGAPAILVRSGERADLEHVAEISMRYARDAEFSLVRSAAMIEYGITRRRLLAGLGPAGLRRLEFFVSEEGNRAVAYVVLLHGKHGVVLEDCGDRDPSGARIGAMLQVLSARTPAEPPLRVRTRLPATLRPPQLRVIEARQISSDVMMIKPLIPGAVVPRSHVYWQLDVF